MLCKRIILTSQICYTMMTNFTDSVKRTLSDLLRYKKKKKEKKKLSGILVSDKTLSLWNLTVKYVSFGRY